MEGQI